MMSRGKSGVSTVVAGSRVSPERTIVAGADGVRPMVRQPPVAAQGVIEGAGWWVPSGAGLPCCGPPWCAAGIGALQPGSLPLAMARMAGSRASAIQRVLYARPRGVIPT